MEKVFFDYKIGLPTIVQENHNDIKVWEMYQLKGITNGYLYIFFNYDDHKKRNFILLETGIIDYIMQFDMLFSYKLNDNDKVNLVSGDYYSNSLRFTYSRESDSLEIYEVNSALYTITCKYKDFKKAYDKFRKKVLSELVVFYPQLSVNTAFIEYFGNISK